MRRIACVFAGMGVVAALVAPGCRSGLPPTEEADGRVVLVSYDAVGADLLQEWLDQDGVLRTVDGVRGMIDHGLWVRRLRMVNPTLTSVNHISLITGAPPSQTGVVSNRFHPAGEPVTETVSGFSAPIEAETLWEAARRQGKRVGVLTWPGADGASEARRGDFGLMWPVHPLVRAEVIDLSPEASEGVTAVPSADGVEPRVWRVVVEVREGEPAAITFDLTAVDGQPNGLAVYDTVAVRPPGADGWDVLGADEQWFPVQVDARSEDETASNPYGAWCKVVHLNTHTGALRLFRGAFWRVMGYPESFEDRVEKEVGFWPGPPETHMLGEWWLDVNEGVDLETVLEQISRFDRYLDRVAALALEAEAPDLLIAYHPTPDEYLHAALIVDERQWAWSPGKELAAREGLKRVGTSFDRSVASLWRELDPGRDVLAVVSDHGMLPITDVVYVNQILADAGLLDIDDSRGYPRPARSSRVVAATSGGCAHLTVNLSGREPYGVVESDEMESVMRRAARALADVEVDGRPVVERIVRREQAGQVGLDHPNSGDLIVFLAPGFAASSRLGGEVVEPSRYYGQHGYLAEHDELCGVFLTRGDAVPHRRVREMPATGVAPRVAGWLGIRAPGR